MPRPCPYCRSVSHGAETCTALTVTDEQRPYIARIIADSGAVYAQEARVFQAERTWEDV